MGDLDWNRFVITCCIEIFKWEIPITNLHIMYISRAASHVSRYLKLYIGGTNCSQLV